LRGAIVELNVTYLIATAVIYGDQPERDGERDGDISRSPRQDKKSGRRKTAAIQNPATKNPIP
jgi:hypothetical protein